MFSKCNMTQTDNKDWSLVSKKMMQEAEYQLYCDHLKKNVNRNLNCVQTYHNYQEFSRPEIAQPIMKKKDENSYTSESIPKNAFLQNTRNLNARM